MTKYYYADLETGLLNGDCIDCIDEQLAIDNAPAGKVPVPGVTDWLRQRYDFDLAELVQHEPVPPSPDHMLAGKRWVLKPEVAERQRRRADALAEIERLETKVQPRIMRELRLADAGKGDAAGAIERLQQVEQRIAECRAVLK